MNAMTLHPPPGDQLQALPATAMALHGEGSAAHLHSIDRLQQRQQQQQERTCAPRCPHSARCTQRRAAASHWRSCSSCSFRWRERSAVATSANVYRSFVWLNRSVSLALLSLLSWYSEHPTLQLLPLAAALLTPSPHYPLHSNLTAGPWLLRVPRASIALLPQHDVE